MGNVDYFLGTEFNWLQCDGGNISVHLYQLELTEFTAHIFSVHTVNKAPNMKPNRLGFPINYIPTVDPVDTDLPCHKQVGILVYPIKIGVQCLQLWISYGVLPLNIP